MKYIISLLILISSASSGTLAVFEYEDKTKTYCIETSKTRYSKNKIFITLISDGNEYYIKLADVLHHELTNNYILNDDTNTCEKDMNSDVLVFDLTDLYFLFGGLITFLVVLFGLRKSRELLR